MLFSLVVPSLLCFTTWMRMVHATQGPMKNCCEQWSDTRVSADRIMNYTMQSDGVCPITAVLFRTVLAKTICSDPNSKWAKRVILKVDKESKALLEKGQDKEGSTSDMTPVASTTSKNALRTNGRNGRRRQRKKTRRGRKGQRKRA